MNEPYTPYVKLKDGQGRKEAEKGLKKVKSMHSMANLNEKVSKQKRGIFESLLSDRSF